MSFHYGQQVEFWTGEEWIAGVVTHQGSEGQLRVELPDADGDPVYTDPFYIRPLQTGVQFRYIKPEITTTAPSLPPFTPAAVLDDEEDGR